MRVADDVRISTLSLARYAMVARGTRLITFDMPSFASLTPMTGLGVLASGGHEEMKLAVSL